MDKNTNTGGPAFPAMAKDMSLRDWFAGQALAGILADPEVVGELKPSAEFAYKMADAMLAEREAKQ